VLALIAFLANMIKYVPEKQPVVELFLKEKNAPFLIYTSLFAAIVGPMIEELFFRGFMYNAFKKRIGIFWAMVITAATFATLHSHVVGFLPIMVLGMLLAYMYEKTGTLVSSITVHMVHNLSMVFLVFLVKQLGVG
jgi:membrane protease YdiL (CAAX protease family)